MSFMCKKIVNLPKNAMERTADNTFNLIEDFRSAVAHLMLGVLSRFSQFLTCRLLEVGV